MASTKETVLYFRPERAGQGGGGMNPARLKSVLVRMGIRIKNISQEQAYETVGYLSGYAGFEKQEPQDDIPVVEDEILVMRNFTDRRLDELLMNLRQAGVPKTVLKAVVTDTNCKWKFCDLYQELLKERIAMSENNEP